MNTIDQTKDELWYRNCPCCGKPIYFSSQITCELSVEISPLCEACRTPIKPGQNRNREIRKRGPRNKIEIISDTDTNFLAKRGNIWITKCPKCKKDILHSNENNARTSLKQKRICRKCSGKDKVKKNNPDFTFRDHEHTEKTKERQSEIACNLWNYRNNILPEILKTIPTGSCLCHKIEK